MRLPKVLLILFSSLIPLSAFGQSKTSPAQENISISVSAQILNSIEIATIQNMSLRNARPSEGVATINPANDVNAGQMKATGQANANVRISYIPDKKLIHVSGKNSLTFYYNVAISKENSQSASQLINSEGQSYQLNENGELFIWVGGRVDLTNAQPGSYLGEFTIQIEYI